MRNNLNQRQQNLLEIYKILTSRARSVSWFPSISFLIFELIHNLNRDLLILNQDSSNKIEYTSLLSNNILNLLLIEIDKILSNEKETFVSEKFIWKDKDSLIYLKEYIEKLKIWLPLDLFK